MSVIGIDMGFLTSTVSSPRGGGIEVLLNEYSQRQTASIVSFSDRQRELGEEGRQKGVSAFKSTVRSFKHIIGRQFDDADVQAILAKGHYRAKKMADGTVGFTCKHLNEDKEFSVVQITAMLLTQLKNSAEKTLGNKVGDCVVGVPVGFNDCQRHAMLAATKIAGLNCLRVFNETSAVALAYGIYKQDLPAEDEKARRVIFCDVGASTFQLSACELKKGKLVVQATASENVGGSDFDDLLFAHFAAEFKAKYKVDVNEQPRAAIRLMVECEKIKKLMSANSTKCKMGIECLMNDVDVQGDMIRADFEEMAAPLLVRIEAAAKRLLEALNVEMEGKFSVDDIDFVEVVGGAVRIPAIKAILTDVFKKELNTTLNTDEATSRGCALQAAISSPTFRVRDFSVVDMTPYAIDLAWTNAGGEPETAQVFKNNGTSHLTKILSFFRSEDFALDCNYSNPADVPGQVKSIGSYTLGGVAPGIDGKSQKIKVKVKLDEHGCFKVDEAHMVEKLPPPAEDDAAAAADADAPADAEAAKDAPADAPADAKADEKKEEPAADAAADAEKPAKKKAKTTKNTPLSITKSQPTTLSDSDIHKLLEIELDLQASDRSEKEKSDAKNALEEYIYHIRDQLAGKYSDYVKEEDKEAYSSKLSSFEDWLYDEGEDVAKSVYTAKLAELTPVGNAADARYQEAESRAPEISKLQEKVVACRKFIELQEGGERRYEHLSKEDMDKVRDAFGKTEKFLNTSVPALQALPKYEDPKTSTAQFKVEREQLEKIYVPIMTKQKPAPPPEPKAEVPAEGEAAADATATATADADATPNPDAETTAPPADTATDATDAPAASSMEVD